MYSNSIISLQRKCFNFVTLYVVSYKQVSNEQPHSHHFYLFPFLLRSSSQLIEYNGSVYHASDIQPQTSIVLDENDGEW